MLGTHTIKTWSSTQSSISLSSWEAEFNGVVRGSGAGLGYKSLLRDLGQELPLRVWTDSSAALGICSRQGLGRLRHLDTHTLWIQQAIRTGAVDLRKVAGETNPADLFTKHSLTREAYEPDEAVRQRIPRRSRRQRREDPHDARVQSHNGRS